MTTDRPATLAAYIRDIGDAQDTLRTVATLTSAIRNIIYTPTGTPAEVAARLRKLSAMLAEAATDAREHCHSIADSITPADDTPPHGITRTASGYTIRAIAD